jgi:ABC-type dipeptide transport system, periplasmic component
MKLSGVAGAAALAGCTGGESSSGEMTANSDGVFDVTLTGATNEGVPSNMHLNPMATQNYDWVAGNHVFERFAAYNFETGEFEMAGLSDWSFEDDTVTLTLRDDLKWDTGDDVTADDVITQFKLMEKPRPRCGISPTASNRAPTTRRSFSRFRSRRTRRSSSTRSQTATSGFTATSRSTTSSWTKMRPPSSSLSGKKTSTVTARSHSTPRATRRGRSRVTSTSTTPRK